MPDGITIVVPISDLGEDRCKRLACCLRSIWRQTYDARMVDVIVSLNYRTVDPPAPEDWARIGELVGAYPFTLVPRAHAMAKYPPSHTKNLGGRWARRRALTFVDADAVLHPEALEVSMELLGDLDATLIQTAMTEYPLGAEEYELSDPWKFETTAMQWPLAIGTGCCTVTTQALWEELGGFDEDFLEWGITDIDFSDRLGLRGVGLHNLTESHGLVNMHQHHGRAGRDMGHRIEEGRREMFDLATEKKARGEWLRNSDRRWGGL